VSRAHRYAVRSATPFWSAQSSVDCPRATARASCDFRFLRSSSDMAVVDTRWPGSHRVSDGPARGSQPGAQAGRHAREGRETVMRRRSDKRTINWTRHLSLTYFAIMRYGLTAALDECLRHRGGKSRRWQQVAVFLSGLLPFQDMIMLFKPSLGNGLRGGCRWNQRSVAAIRCHFGATVYSRTPTETMV
jgi:hypothetical protein